MCRAAGIAPPEFAEISGAAIVVFRVDVVGAAGAYPQVAPQVTLQVSGILKAAVTPSSAVHLQQAAGLKDKEYGHPSKMQIKVGIKVGVHVFFPTFLASANLAAARLSIHP